MLRIALYRAAHRCSAPPDDPIHLDLVPPICSSHFETSPLLVSSSPTIWYSDCCTFVLHLANRTPSLLILSLTILWCLALQKFFGNLYVRAPFNRLGIVMMSFFVLSSTAFGPGKFSLGAVIVFPFSCDS